jgi:hypothetical protein
LVIILKKQVNLFFCYKKYFVSIAKDDDGYFAMVTAHSRRAQILKMMREGSITYQTDSLFSLQILQGFYDTALVAPKRTTPNYTTLEFGFPFQNKGKKNTN